MEKLWDEVFGAEGLGVEVEVGQDDAFWLAGGATGVHDDGVVLSIDAGMRVADVFAGFHKKSIPGDDVLGFLNVVFATLGELV